MTGAAGFVGRHLLDLLQAEGTQIVAWRKPAAGAAEQDIDGVRWMNIDLLDRAAVAGAVAETRPAAVYHLAGSAHVAASWSHPHETFAVNALGSHHLFEALQTLRPAPRVLSAGSATIYAASAGTIAEDAAIQPASPYATSKLAQEMLGQRAWTLDRLPVLLVRAFNHIGPGQTPDYVAPSIARQIAMAEAGQIDPVLRLGNLEAERDLSDVRDVVGAYQALMEHGHPGVPYNVCAGQGVIISALVEQLVSRSTIPLTIAQDPAKLRPSDVPRVVGSAARLTRDTGWLPRLSISQTLDDLLKYWRGVVRSPEALAVAK